MENNEIAFDERTYDQSELVCIPGEGAGLLTSPIETVLAVSIPDNRLHAGRKCNFIKGNVTVVYGENMASSYPAVFKFYKRKNKLKFDDNNPRGMYDLMDYDKYDKYSVTFDGNEYELPPTRISYNRLKDRFYINSEHPFAWNLTPLTLDQIVTHVERFNNQLETDRQTTGEIEF